MSRLLPVAFTEQKIEPSEEEAKKEGDPIPVKAVEVDDFCEGNTPLLPPPPALPIASPEAIEPRSYVLYLGDKIISPNTTRAAMETPMTEATTPFATEVSSYNLTTTPSECLKKEQVASQWSSFDSGTLRTDKKNVASDRTLSPLIERHLKFNDAEDDHRSNSTSVTGDEAISFSGDGVNDCISDDEENRQDLTSEINLISTGNEGDDDDADGEAYDQIQPPPPPPPSDMTSPEHNAIIFASPFASYSKEPTTGAVFYNGDDTCENTTDIDDDSDDDYDGDVDDNECDVVASDKSSSEYIHKSMPSTPDPITTPSAAPLSGSSEPISDTLDTKSKRKLSPSSEEWLIRYRVAFSSHRKTTPRSASFSGPRSSSTSHEHIKKNTMDDAPPNSAAPPQPSAVRQNWIRDNSGGVSRSMGNLSASTISGSAFSKKEMVRSRHRRTSDPSTSLSSSATAAESDLLAKKRQPMTARIRERQSTLPSQMRSTSLSPRTQTASISTLYDTGASERLSRSGLPQWHDSIPGAFQVREEESDISSSPTEEAVVVATTESNQGARSTITERQPPPIPPHTLTLDMDQHIQNERMARAPPILTTRTLLPTGSIGASIMHTNGRIFQSPSSRQHRARQQPRQQQLQDQCRQYAEVQRQSSWDGRLASGGNSFSFREVPKTSQRRGSWWKVFVAIFLTTVIVVITVMLVALFSPSSATTKRTTIDDQEATSPSPSPTASTPLSYFDTLKRLVIPISGSHAFSEEDDYPLTAQSKALHWIVHEDQIQVDPNNARSVEGLIQRYILAVFFFSTGGKDSWVSFPEDGWLSKSQECRWDYVLCDPSANVVSIDINVAEAGNGLKGTFPIEVMQLSSLERLHMSYNRIKGSIPTQLGSLSSLVSLNLAFNEFHGSLPSQIGALQSLESISVESNKLQGQVPVELWNVTTLRQVNLGSNFFTGKIPKEIAQLVNLEHLGLYVNSFTGTVPERIDLNTNLESIDFAKNKLEGPMPASLGALEKLAYVDLSNNKLNGTLVPEIGRLHKLEALFFNKNDIIGSIPTEFGKLHSLVALDGNQNDLSGVIPSEIGNLDLHSLNLWGNRIKGTIPTSVGNMKNVERIWLNFNYLSGRIPVQLGQLSNLRLLYLEGNLLHGSVPADVCNIGTLEELIVDCRVSCDCCKRECTEA